MESILLSQSNGHSPKEILNPISRLRLLSSNSLITIYEKHSMLPFLNIGWVQYYFRSSSSNMLMKLTRKNLIRMYRYTEFENTLKLFLKTKDTMAVDRFTDELELLQIISDDVYSNTYQLLKYKLKFGITL